MKEKIARFLLRKYQEGSLSDSEFLRQARGNADQILSLIREEIEKVENPIDTVVMYGGNAQFSYEHLVQKQHDAFEKARQAIIKALES